MVDPGDFGAFRISGTDSVRFYGYVVSKDPGILEIRIAVVALQAGFVVDVSSLIAKSEASLQTWVEPIRHHLCTCSGASRSFDTGL